MTNRGLVGIQTECATPEAWCSDLMGGLSIRRSGRRRGYQPMTAVAIRFIIAALLTFFILAVRKTPLPRTREFL
jgi:hypothetical protein